jgi:acetyl esterase/lipase
MIRLIPKLFATALVSGPLLAGCSTHLGQVSAQSPNGDDYTIERIVEDIVYTPEDWPQALAGDLYLPARRGSLPVVLVVHGGGWANRSRDDMEDVSRKLARHGYAVFNIGYRFAPRYTYPAQLHDTRQALGWLAAHAQRYRFDLERINAWGYSSGAHLAALLGSHDGADQSAELPAVNAVVAGGTPADLRKYSGSPIVMRFMGGDRHEMPARYAEASPAWHISPGDPAVFLYHGKLDFLVTIDQATDYYEALRAAGIEAELFLKSWRGHMSMFLFGEEAEDRAIAFLDRQNSPRAISSATRD